MWNTESVHFGMGLPKMLTPVQRLIVTVRSHVHGNVCGVWCMVHGNVCGVWCIVMCVVYGAL